MSFTAGLFKTYQETFFDPDLAHCSKVNISTPLSVFPLTPDAKERSAKRFSVDGVFNYTSLLLSKEDNMLYVGAREELFALNLSDISRVKLQRNVSGHECVSVCFERRSRGSFS